MSNKKLSKVVKSMVLVAGASCVVSMYVKCIREIKVKIKRSKLINDLMSGEVALSPNDFFKIKNKLCKQNFVVKGYYVIFDKTTKKIYTGYSDDLMKKIENRLVYEDGLLSKEDDVAESYFNGDSLVIKMVSSKNLGVNGLEDVIDSMII